MIAPPFYSSTFYTNRTRCAIKIRGCLYLSILITFTHMSSSNCTYFAKLCRELRIEKHLKYREVASGIGIATTSYGNIESSPWRVVGEDRAKAIADFYQLDPDRRAVFMQAWSETPISKFSVERAEKWRVQNARKSAAKRLPKLELAALNLLGFAVQFVPDAELCRCGFDGKVEGGERSCEVCEALLALGLDTFSTREKLVEGILKLHAKLEAAPAVGGA